MSLEAHDLDTATLMQSQIKTLRVQIHAVECRLFDMEMAQTMGAARADTHAEEIKSIKDQLADIISGLDGITSP